MRRQLVRAQFIIAVIAGFTLALPSVRAEEPEAGIEPRVEQSLATLMTAQRIPGLSAAVAINNELCFSRGFGQADVENCVPATTYTRYRTASVAKPMTAAVVMSLVEEGAIDLDAPVQQYCPAYPEKRWPLTSRLLLGHLGGVRHYRDGGEALSTAHFFSLDAALSTFADDPLLHEPGTKFRYSTFGYDLLGSVAEGAGGKDFMDLLRERVLEPAGMSRTVMDDHFAVIPGRARGYFRETSVVRDLPTGYNRTDGELYNAPPHDTSMKIPGGGLLSTAPDLVRFGVAMNTGTLVGGQTREQMWTSQSTTSGEETGYGMGWRVGEHSGRRIVWHTGGQAGTSTVLLIVPETGTCVAIMCNLQHAALFESACEIADAVGSTESPTPVETSN